MLFREYMNDHVTVIHEDPESFILSFDVVAEDVALIKLFLDGITYRLNLPCRGAMAEEEVICKIAYVLQIENYRIICFLISCCFECQFQFSFQYSAPLSVEIELPDVHFDLIRNEAVDRLVLPNFFPDAARRYVHGLDPCEEDLR